MRELNKEYDTKVCCRVENNGLSRFIRGFRVQRVHVSVLQAAIERFYFLACLVFTINYFHTVDSFTRLKAIKDLRYR